MGVVYAAEDARLGRTVALKMLPSRLQPRPGRARAAVAAKPAPRRRSRIPASRRSTPSKRSTATCSSPPSWCAGPRCAPLLASGPYPRERLLDTVTQIAEALEAAHRHGIVHRDLKPENVLRGDDGRLKIVDFGIARTSRRCRPRRPASRLTGTRLGTPGYMAPEQLRGQPVDARADIFAFGVMAYELATGLASLRRQRSGRPPRASASPTIRRFRGRSNRPGSTRSSGCVSKGSPRDASPRAPSWSRRCVALHQTGVAAAIEPAPAPRAAWWWKFHQVAVAFLTIVAVITVGVRRQWIGQYGSSVFLAVLVLATISTTLRLHMWFVSQVQPALLAALRARVLRWVVIVEALLVTLFMGIGDPLRRTPRRHVGATRRRSPSCSSCH